MAKAPEQPRAGTDAAPREGTSAIMRPNMPEELVEALAELWCEAMLANLRRHPITPALRRAS